MVKLSLGRGLAKEVWQDLESRFGPCVNKCFSFMLFPMDPHTSPKQNSQEERNRVELTGDFPSEVGRGAMC